MLLGWTRWYAAKPGAVCRQLWVEQSGNWLGDGGVCGWATLLSAQDVEADG